MFDYIMFFKYGTGVAMAFFTLRLVAGISLWYDHEVGKNKDIEKLKLLLEGKKIKSYGVMRSIGYLILSILIFISIK
jgi:hypothetical protein